MVYIISSHAHIVHFVCILPYANLSNDVILNYSSWYSKK